MATKSLPFKHYCYLLNRIAYWLIVNKKSFKTRNKYTYNGKTKKLSEIKKIISKQGKSFGVDPFVARFVECAILDNSSTDYLPNYVLSKNSKRKYSKSSFVDAVKRVNIYEIKYKKSPAHVKMVYTASGIKPSDSGSSSSSNCKNPYTSSPHPTKAGCNGMGQNNGYYCGVSAVQKVLYKFGIRDYSQEQLARIAGTTTSGTDHDGLNTVIAWVGKQKGVNFDVEWKNFSDLGWEKLGKIICQKNKDVIIHNLYRDRWGHYETVNQINLSNNNIMVLNSLGDYCNNDCYCGYVEDRTMADFRRYISGISQKSIMIITKK